MQSILPPQAMNWRRSFSAFGVTILAAGLATSLAGARPRPAPQELTVTPYKASGIYDRQEKAGWTVTLPEGSKEKFTYQLKRFNKEMVAGGELEFKDGKATIEMDSAQPAMFYMELYSADNNNKPRIFGAAIAPTELKPVSPR